MELVKYETPEEIYSAMFGIDMSEMEGMTLEGFNLKGDVVITTVEDAIAGIKLQGLFGFAESSTIHYWVDLNVCTDESLLHFIAHEVGHTTQDDDMDELQSEVDAEKFGYVTTKSVELMNSIKGINTP